MQTYVKKIVAKGRAYAAVLAMNADNALSKEISDLLAQLTDELDDADDLNADMSKTNYKQYKKIQKLKKKLEKKASYSCSGCKYSAGDEKCSHCVRAAMGDYFEKEVEELTLVEEKG